MRNVVWFYVIYLATIVPLFWIPAEHQASAELIIGWIDALIILSYWRLSNATLLPALRPQRALLRPLLVACAALVVLLPINAGYHALLQHVFALDPSKLPAITDSFTLAGYGLAVQLFAIALMPAVWEELAFRGLIQGRLRAVVGNAEAIGLTAALFAIIHVQWLSLPYLFLLGVVLGILRARSNSLLPGMVLHALHNAAVILW